MKAVEFAALNEGFKHVNTAPVIVQINEFLVCQKNSHVVFLHYIQSKRHVVKHARLQKVADS